MYTISVEKKAAKVLSKLDAKTYRIISKATLKLEEFNLQKNLDIKMLKGKYVGMYRLRIGSRRVFFTVDERGSKLKIWLIENRGEAY